MVTSKKVKGNAVSMPLGVMYGLVTTIIISISTIALLVGGILAEKVNEVHIGYFIILILLVSSFCGGLVSVTRVKRRMMLVSGIVGIGYFSMLLLVTAVAFGGRFGGMWMSGMVILLGSAGAGGLGLSLNKKARRSYRKYNAG